jgi:nucleoid-associated protein YgaU
MRSGCAAIRSFLGLAVLTGTVLAGCSHGPVPPAKDPTKGEFYTTEEMQRLPKGERTRYCEVMESSLRSFKDETRLLQVRLDSLSAVADTLRNRSVAVSQQTRDLNQAIRDLRLKDKAINSYVVKKGDTLRIVARTVYGDPTRWREIYEANKGALGPNPEKVELREGSRLTIPKGTETPQKPTDGNKGQ